MVQRGHSGSPVGLAMVHAALGLLPCVDIGLQFLQGIELPSNPRRIAADNSQRRHIFGHHGSGGNDGVFTDGHAAKDHRAGSQAGKLLYNRARIDHMPVGAWKKVVGEHHSMGDEDVVLKFHAGAKKRVALDDAPAAHCDATGDFHKGADEGIVAYRAAEDVNLLRVENFHPLAEDDIRINHVLFAASLAAEMTRESVSSGSSG